MSKSAGVELVTLHGSVGERVSLGWRPVTAMRRAVRRAADGEIRWLVVHGEVRCPEGDWSFRDESLTEDEAVELVEFLSVRPWSGERHLTFIEPCLSFSTSGELGGRFNLDVCFKGEVSPPFLHGDGDAVWDTGFTLGLFVKEEELRRFADGLRRMLGG